MILGASCPWLGLPWSKQVLGQNKSSSQSNMNRETTRTVTSAGLCSRGPTLGPGLGLGLESKRLVAFAHGARMGSGGFTTRRGFHRCRVQSELVCSRGQRPRQPTPQAQNLAVGTWNVTSLRGKEPELVQEVPARYSRAHLHAQLGLWNPTSQASSGGVQVCRGLVLE
ncbi:hypothetical protein NL108_017165 [Boleophthalmus pectinirostris]|nr:hypothetical protein NL108_017165 [Boleophthalmus pectinirostris]